MEFPVPVIAVIAATPLTAPSHAIHCTVRQPEMSGQILVLPPRH